MNLTIWNEFRHERQNEQVRAIYPEGMHVTIGRGVSDLIGDAVAIRYATLDEPEHGLGGEVLDQTDVLVWWGHAAHGEVSDHVVERVVQRVWAGMGLIVLHSGHYSKAFKRLMGTGCGLRWRVAGEMERLWVVDPGHEIAAGIGEYFELPATEMYGEFFDIPQPDELVLISWFAGGEVFRSGCCFRRGKGRIFYFRPGHELYPIYHDRKVQRVIANAVKWAAAKSDAPYTTKSRNITPPLNPIDRAERGG